MAVKRERKATHSDRTMSSSSHSITSSTTSTSNLSLYTGFLHLFGFIIMGSGTYMETFVIQYGWNTFWGKMKYLTYWNIWIQTIYFVLSLLFDLMKWRNVKVCDQNKIRRLQKLINHIHSTIAFPVGIFVVVTFWLIYHFDRELVFPVFLDDIIPGWLNHILHTVPMVLLFLDKYLVHHTYPSKVRGVFYTVGYTSTYIALVLYLAFKKGIWVYPILQVLSNHQRFVFILLLWMFGVSIYLLGDGISCFLWRASQTTRSKRHKAK